MNEIRGIENCCLNCPNKCVGCHSTCKKYNKAKLENEKRKSIVRNAFCKEAVYLEYVHESRLKYTRG